MKILVTGANSLLGTNILVELLQRGFEVKAMVRAKNKLLVSHPLMEVCVGDITDESAVMNAVRGCGVIIHVAANTSQSSVHYRTYERVNVKGTLHVINAAHRGNAKRVILVSSANAFAYGSLTHPGTEALPIKYPFSRAGYACSKFTAQQYVLAHLNEIGPEVIVVNPTFMLGKYDGKPSSGEIILRGYKKKWILCPPGGKNFIHVKDVAVAICNTIQAGAPGECYLLSGENMSYKAFYKKLVDITGQKSKIVILPKAVLLLIGVIGTIIAAVGIPTSVHYINMRILCVKNYYSNSKAKSELHLPSTPISVAIREAIGWFIEKGMIKEKGHGQK